MPTFPRAARPSTSTKKAWTPRAPIAKVPRKPFNATAAHESIFAAIAARKVNVQISAAAGSGKTSTIVEALHRCLSDAQRRDTAMLAFNGSIRDELEARTPVGVNTMTINSLGNRALTSALGSRQADTGKTRNIAKGLLSKAEEPALTAVLALVGHAKAAGLIPTGVKGAARVGLMPDVDASWEHLMNLHDVELPVGIHPAVAFDLARKVMRAGLETFSVVDFDDQLLMPFTYGWQGPRFSTLFVDEAQDLSPIQHELLAASLRAGGMLVSVGDERQAIYGWRGAAADSMPRLATRFNMECLPLHRTYRCAPEIVALARDVSGVTHIEADPSNRPATRVDADGITLDAALKEMRAGDLVTSRFNAPLVKVANALIRAGKPVLVRGRDIGANMFALIEKMKASDVPTLLTRLTAWVESVRAVAQSKGGDEAAVLSAEDRADTLRVFCEGVNTIPELQHKVTEFFKLETESGEAAGKIVLSSVHRAKGTEAERTFALNFGMRPKFARQPWQITQEDNLLYVQATRGKVFFQNVLIPRG